MKKIFSILAVLVFASVMTSCTVDEIPTNDQNNSQDLQAGNRDDDGIDPPKVVVPPPPPPPPGTPTTP